MPLLLSGARRRESQGASSDTCPPVCATHRWRLPSFSAPSPQVSGSRDRTNMEPPHPPTHPGWAPTEAGVRHIAHLLAEVHTPGANQGQVRNGGVKRGAGACARARAFGGERIGSFCSLLSSPFLPGTAPSVRVGRQGRVVSRVWAVWPGGFGGLSHHGTRHSRANSGTLPDGPLFFLTSSISPFPLTPRPTFHPPDPRPPGRLPGLP